ncbi:MAG: ImmA/IrrE family metallo-endopeptidase [Candidatus Lindowbacteria bacterium]|nr:ImmA/IrrE family metallo-endopeptidase [Candidatus Lindowbacteria bacterium]
MSLQVLAQNVRRLRIARRLSQSDLAEAAGLSLPAIKNLELAKNEPRMRTVQAIARALDVKLQELFLPVRELKTVRFRSARRMQNRENVLAEVARWIDDFNYLEKVLDEKVPFGLRQFKTRCSRGDVIGAAAFCRRKLGLKPDEPIHDICGLLESAGVKVLSIPMASDGFFGMSVGEKDGGPAVVVNVWERISVERRIFSAAHELGHLMLHPNAYDVTRTAEDNKEEREADLFAGHFLMPDDGFRKEWNESAGLHWVDRVFKVKRIFRVSYKTVLFRLIERKVADKSVWARFHKAYQQKFNRRLQFIEEPMAFDSSEPYGMERFDFYGDRFSRLIRGAVEKDMISLSRGTEMLGISIDKMQDLLQNWEAVV